MKKFTLYGLALLLVASTSIAFAGDRDHRRHDKHDRQYSSKHERHYNKHDRHYNKHYNRHYKTHYNRYYSGHGFRSHRGYRSHHGFRGGYYPHYYYPSAYLGAALIGSAINYSLYHQHNGATCYDNHSSDRNRSSDRNYSEVVGCHRIERLADGSERRVDVPLSQCK